MMMHWNKGTSHVTKAGSTYRIIHIDLDDWISLFQQVYLVFAESHHGPVGCVCSGKDVWRVVSPLHAVVQLRELTGRQTGVSTSRPRGTVNIPTKLHDK